MEGSVVTTRLLAGAAVTVALLGVAAPARAAWNQPVGGPSPINNASDRSGNDPTLVQVAGVPYVAWVESDGTNDEVRVSRLSATGLGWEQVVGGASPVNNAPDSDAADPTMAVVGSAPYVAWVEDDGTNDELRVSRLNEDGTAWVQVVGGPKPLNLSPSRSASHPTLTSIDGVPHVAWRENDGTNDEIRAARLRADGTGWQHLGSGGSPINFSAIRDASSPSIVGIGGVPYVAWREFDGTVNQIRVARYEASGNTWEPVGNGASPVNRSPTADAASPSLVELGGVPYLAWRESDGTNNEVRVARLDPSGNAWSQVVDGESPINHSPTMNAFRPRLSVVGGALYVAWDEEDGTNNEGRVSRLNAARTGWQQIVGGASPINQANDRNAINLGLADIGGVPYVAWRENDGTNNEVRVSRLEPEILSTSETVTDDSATLSAEVRTFGVAYPFLFHSGPGAALTTLSDTVMAESENATSATVTHTLTGLSTFTEYSWRLIAHDRTRATLVGPTRTFRTTDSVPPVLSEVRLNRRVFAVDPKGAPETRVARRRRAKRGVLITFTLSEPARVVFALERRTEGRRVGRECKKRTRRNKRRRRCARYIPAGKFAVDGAAGPNRKRFSGIIGTRGLRAAGYRLTLVATDVAGNASSPKRLGFEIVR